MNVEAKSVVADQDAARARRRQAGSKRRASSSGSTTAQDGTGFDDDAYRHVFVVPATGGTPRQLTDGNWNHNGVEWTPDSKQILFGSLRIGGRRVRVARVGNLLGQRRHRRDHAAHAPQGPRRQPAGVARRQARRLHRQRLVEGHVAGQQAVRDEHRRQQPAHGVGHVGSLAAERHVEGRRQRRLFHRAGSGIAEPLLPAARRARGPTKCRP